MITIGLIILLITIFISKAIDNLFPMIEKPIDLEELHRRYLNDDRVKALNTRIAQIYNFAKPTYIMSDSGELITVHDEHVEKLADHCRRELEMIQQQHYRELV